MTAVTIRKATYSDAESIAKVHVQSWQESYKGILPESYLSNLNYQQRLPKREKILERDNPNECHFVATIGSNVIGFTDAGPCDTQSQGYRGAIYTLYLLEKYHKRGIGKLLFDASLQYLRSVNLLPCMTWVLADNKNAQRFYGSNGGIKKFEEYDCIQGKQYLEFGYVFDV